MFLIREQPPTPPSGAFERPEVRLSVELRNILKVRAVWVRIATTGRNVASVTSPFSYHSPLFTLPRALDQRMACVRVLGGQPEFS